MIDPPTLPYARLNTGPALSPGIRRIVFIITSINVAISILPRLLLALRGLDLSDVWGSGQIRPIPTTAKPLVVPLDVIAYAGELLSLATLAVAIALAIHLLRARIRQREWVVLAVLLAAGFVCGSCSLQTGFYLAGI